MARKSKIKLINPERKPLTADKLRELSGMKDISDDQAEEIIHSIRLLVKILYEAAKQKDTICIDNQFVVNCEEESKKAA